MNNHHLLKARLGNSEKSELFLFEVSYLVLDLNNNENTIIDQ